MSITKPFTEYFRVYFNYTKSFELKELSLNNLHIKILKNSYELPLPGGSWIHSSRDYSVKNNTLYTHCRTIDGRWLYNEHKFLVGDMFENINGKLVPNRIHNKLNFSLSSSFIYDNENVYFNHEK